jgi:hypothetical protein
MLFVSRLALVISIVFCGSLAMAVAVVAAGGGGFAPGVYTFTNKDAYATFGGLKGGPPNQQGFSVQVDKGLNAFRPRDPGGPPTVMKSTMVNLAVFDSLGNASFGCFIVNPSDFSVSQDLQSARLHTTLTADQLCPGSGAPVTGRTGGAAVPFAGGGGGTSLPLPISLDLRWKGVGVITTGSDVNTLQCLDYKTRFSSDFLSTNSKASGTMSALSGSFDTMSAAVSTSETHGVVKDTPQPACLPQ